MKSITELSLKTGWFDGMITSVHYSTDDDETMFLLLVSKFNWERMGQSQLLATGAWLLVEP